MTFTATGLADVNTAYMTAVPGSDGQSATAGAAVAISPSVRVLDSGGNGVPNVSVTFTVTSGGGSATGTTVSTNASGIATVGKWVLGPAVGANTLQAAASVTGSPVTFTVHGTVGAATQILAVSDTDQSGIAGGQAPIPPSVVVEDANNNPVPGVSVTFAVDSGGGTVGGSPAVTNSSGIATVGSWTLGSGANELTATAAGVSGSVAFTASAALIVTGADTVADLHIANGTSLGAAEAALPATVGISLSDGTSATANVTWNEGSPPYDGDTAGSYPFVGTLSPPDGVSNPNAVTAAVTVDVGAPTVTSADSITDVSVDNGTSLGAAKAALPATVGVTLSNGDSATVDVTWAQGSPPYSGGTAGSYPFIGTLSSLPAGVTNPSDVTAAVNVDVGAPIVTAAHSIADVAVDNGTSLGDAEAALPATVGITLSNGDSATADVTWNPGSPSYDGGTQGSYPFVGTLSGLPDGVTNPSGVTAAVTVDVGAPTVVGADSIADVAVDNGTSLGDAEAALPVTVGVSLSNGGSAIVDVTWAEGSSGYDGGTAGSYPFVGTLSGLPAGVTNPSGVTAAVNVDVGA